MQQGTWLCKYLCSVLTQNPSTLQSPGLLSKACFHQQKTYQTQAYWVMADPMSLWYVQGTFFFYLHAALCQSGDLVSLQRSSVCQPGTWSAGPLTPYSRHWRSISKTLRPNQTTQNLTSDTGEKPPSLHDKQLSQTSHRARKWVNCVPHISVSPNKETHNDGVTNIS